MGLSYRNIYGKYIGLCWLANAWLIMLVLAVAVFVYGKCPKITYTKVSNKIS